MTSPRALGAATAALLSVIVLTGCSAWSPGTPAGPAGSTRSPAAQQAEPTPTVDLLTAADLACGASIDDDVFTNNANTVPLQHTRADIAFDLSNVAAAGDHRATVVSARIGASASGDRTSPARFRGPLQLALVQHGRVVATGSSAPVVGSTRGGATTLVSGTSIARSCTSGRQLAGGTYALVVVGPTIRYLGERVQVADAVRTLRLVDGVLAGTVVSAPDGPWHGSGVPTCGTAASRPALERFAEANRARRSAAGLTARITGFTPHANAQGWSFTVRVRNGGSRSVTLTEGGSSTAVVAGGRIVSAPDSIDFAVDAPRTLTLGAGHSVTVLADAPRAGCTLSTDYTTFGPRLPDTVHVAYLDLGLVTRGGLGVVLVQRYDFHGRRGGRTGEPELVG